CGSRSQSRGRASRSPRTPFPARASRGVGGGSTLSTASRAPGASRAATSRKCGSKWTGSAAERAFQFLLVHPGATLHASLAGFVVELLIGSPAASPVRSQAAPPPRGEAVRGGPAGGGCLAGPGTLLVDRPGSDLLGGVFVAAPLQKSFLDVLLLASTFLAPGLLWHPCPPL